ncbi:MAG: peptidoglycan-associated lipoprotein Pal [Rhodoferax sp.]|nr:peptidoglycan-associated lipoprotein Pal [Rhodoferax sp.]
MRRLFLALGVSVLLSACGSAVKLDGTAGVEDKTGTSVSKSATDGTGASKTDVKPVDVGDARKDGMTPNGPRIVYFDYDSYVIKPEFQTVIDAHARHIKADKARKVAIEGHTDERGGREYNLALGQRRSEAVRRALALLGVPDGQMEAVSFGKEKPAAVGSDENAWSRNRRAEISYR